MSRRCFLEACEVNNNSRSDDQSNDRDDRYDNDNRPLGALLRCKSSAIQSPLEKKTTQQLEGSFFPQLLNSFVASFCKHLPGGGGAPESVGMAEEFVAGGRVVSTTGVGTCVLVFTCVARRASKGVSNRTPSDDVVQRTIRVEELFALVAGDVAGAVLVVGMVPGVVLVAAPTTVVVLAGVVVVVVGGAVV